MTFNIPDDDWGHHQQAWEAEVTPPSGETNDSAKPRTREPRTLRGIAGYDPASNRDVDVTIAISDEYGDGELYVTTLAQGVELGMSPTLARQIASELLRQADNCKDMS